MSTKKNNKTKKSNKSNENVKNKLSKNAKENIIIGIGLILFIVIISIVVYYVIRTNNPDSFKTEQELYEDMLANMIDENKKTEEEDKNKNNGTFSVLVDNIFLEGKLPKNMKSKYYIECYRNGLINIYSKYTYALSQTKYNEPKGIVLQILVATDDILKSIEEEGEKYNLITKINKYSIVYVIPSTTEYLEDDEVSKSNYEKLAKYREEIIKSITVKENEEEVDINFQEIFNQIENNKGIHNSEY